MNLDASYFQKRIQFFSQTVGTWIAHRFLLIDGFAFSSHKYVFEVLIFQVMEVFNFNNYHPTRLENVAHLYLSSYASRANILGDISMRLPRFAVSGRTRRPLVLTDALI